MIGQTKINYVNLHPTGAGEGEAGLLGAVVTSIQDPVGSSRPVIPSDIGSRTTDLSTWAPPPAAAAFRDQDAVTDQLTAPRVYGRDMSAAADALAGADPSADRRFSIEPSRGRAAMLRGTAAVERDLRLAMSALDSLFTEFANDVAAAWS